ncbi:hypothetical protein [Thioalkalivibrio sp. XN8]|uniref:hypothetical protein n=1 Tax=Thioalkalivibrio sp. XN8 TaxID=2712863 RepID=UPI0013EC7F5F|nr:hypothetical protein [Thioalkalivibrio sp. XN8]NGP52297.1 hypothetical protein [Thioalkalivibrio sp. XN8]
MTLFEYLAIAFGLLYSLAALRILGGLRAAIDPSRRYWVHLVMSLLMLATVAASFWAFWSYREVVEWTFPRFVLALSLPGLIYFMAVALIPENPEQVKSWREHYFHARVALFSGFSVWGLSAGLNASLNLDMALNHPARLVHVSAVLIGALGAVSSNERVHQGIVLFGVFTVALWGLTIGLGAGALAS